MTTKYHYVQWSITWIYGECFSERYQNSYDCWWTSGLMAEEIFSDPSEFCWPGVNLPQIADICVKVSDKLHQSLHSLFDYWLEKATLCNFA